MRYSIGEASSWKEITLWRKAAQMNSVALWIEIREDRVRPDYLKYHESRVSAEITLYAPDLDWMSAKYYNKLAKLFKCHEDDISFDRMVNCKIKDIQETYQKLFDATPAGKIKIAEKKAEEKKKADEEMDEWLRSPDTQEMFAYAIKSRFASEKSLLTRVFDSIKNQQPLNFPVLERKKKGKTDDNNITFRYRSVQADYAAGSV